jgi:hypothetical protein
MSSEGQQFETVVKKTTDQASMELTEKVEKNTEWNFRKMFVIYIHEFFEVFVSIIIIRIAMDKQVDIYKITQASAAIGLITFILENYNTDFKSNIKQGITFSVGSQMMSSFMN